MERKKWQENGEEEIFEVIVVENFSILMTETKPQDQDAQRQRWWNVKNKTEQNSKAYCIKLQETRNRDNLKGSQRKNTPYLARNKDTIYIRFLFRNYASKKRVEGNI